MVDASTPEGVAEQQEAARQREIETRGVLQSILQNAAGRRWFYELVNDVCMLNKSITTPGYGDNPLYFYEGRRQVGLGLQELALQLTPELYKTAVSENLNSK